MIVPANGVDLYVEVHGDGDPVLLHGARMRASAALGKGAWRYAEIAGASHWIALDAPDELNGLLLDWLRSAGAPA